MSSAEQQHPVETMVEWLAPIPLALAVAWSGRQLGLSTAEYAAAGIAVLTAGLTAIRLGGKRVGTIYSFEPAVFEGEGGELPELLLEAKDELLELDDPLVEAAPDSRVVRLFARQGTTPGELVERIEDFLGDGVRSVSPVQSQQAMDQKPVDASAALHAALANIRASLR